MRTIKDLTRFSILGRHIVASWGSKSFEVTGGLSNKNIDVGADHAVIGFTPDMRVSKIYWADRVTGAVRFEEIKAPKGKCFIYPPVILRNAGSTIPIQYKDIAVLLTPVPIPLPAPAASRKAPRTVANKAPKRTTKKPSKKAP